MQQPWSATRSIRWMTCAAPRATSARWLGCGPNARCWSCCLPDRRVARGTRHLTLSVRSVLRLVPSPATNAGGFWHGVRMADGTGVFSPPHRALSIGILVSISAMAAEGMAVATVMPTAGTELGGLDGYGWAFSPFLVMRLLCAIGGGPADGRGSVAGSARLGFAAFAAGLLVAGLAPTWPVLLV